MKGAGTALAILQRYVSNQGNGWAYCINYLQRHLEEFSSLPPGANSDPAVQPHALCTHMITVLGKRTRQLHQALARFTGHSDFDPEPLSADDAQRWQREITALADHAFSQLRAQAMSSPANKAPHIDVLLRQENILRARMATMLPKRLSGVEPAFTVTIIWRRF